MTLPPILTVDQAAELLQCEPDTVRVKLRAGRLPGVREGRDWVIPSGALLRRLEELALEEAAERRKPAPPRAVQLKPVQPPASRRRVPPVLPPLPAT